MSLITIINCLSKLISNRATDNGRCLIGSSDFAHTEVLQEVSNPWMCLFRSQSSN